MTASTELSPSTEQDSSMDERTNLEKVALAIQVLTYAEMMSMAGSIRDIIQDRVTDDPEAFSDIDQIASILHGWAEGEASDA